MYACIDHMLMQERNPQQSYAVTEITCTTVACMGLGLQIKVTAAFSTTLVCKVFNMHAYVY